jgi:hypothetical protein
MGVSAETIKLKYRMSNRNWHAKTKGQFQLQATIYYVLSV